MSMALLLVPTILLSVDIDVVVISSPNEPFTAYSPLKSRSKPSNQSLFMFQLSSKYELP